MSPSEAMPITTVTKITGAVTVLMSCRNASASHFASVAGPGATSPNTMPAAIATRTQNHSCRFMEASSSHLSTRGTPPRTGREGTGGQAAVVLVVVVVEGVVVVAETRQTWDHAADAGAEPRRAPAGPPAHGRRGHRRRRRADHRARRARADRDGGARPQPHRGAHRRRAARRSRRRSAQQDPSATLQPLAETLRTEARVSFITIMRPDGIRYTHPTPSLIGKRFVGTFEPAARGADGHGDHQGHTRPLRPRRRPGARERGDRRAGRRRRAHGRDRRRGRPRCCPA